MTFCICEFSILWTGVGSILIEIIEHRFKTLGRVIRAASSTLRLQKELACWINPTEFLLINSYKQCFLHSSSVALSIGSNW